MKKLCTTLVVNGISLFLISYLFEGITIENSAMITMILVLWLFNSFIKPILKILAFPVTILTLGLFSFVINGFVLYLSFSFVSGASCDSFITCIGAGIVLSVLNTAFSGVFTK